MFKFFGICFFFLFFYLLRACINVHGGGFLEFGVIELLCDAVIPFVTILFDGLITPSVQPFSHKNSTNFCTNIPLG